MLSSPLGWSVNLSAFPRLNELCQTPKLKSSLSSESSVTSALLFNNLNFPSEKGHDGMFSARQDLRVFYWFFLISQTKQASPSINPRKQEGETDGDVVSQLEKASLEQRKGGSIPWKIPLTMDRSDSKGTGQLLILSSDLAKSEFSRFEIFK